MDKSKLKQKYGQEEVLVVTTPSVANIPDKYSTDRFSLKDKTYKFIFRYDAEYSLEYTQIIPYVVVTNLKGDKLYITERLAGEERLTHSLSCGVGGHINPIDNSKDILLTAALRELSEELQILKQDMDTIKRLGTVRDLTSSTPDHLGVVYLVKASKVSVKEKKSLKGKWMDRDQLLLNYERFESWARIFIDHLIGTIPAKIPFFSDSIRLMPKRKRGT